MTGRTHGVSTETALELLAHSTRRSVLTPLIDSEDDVVPVDAIVEHVALENPPPEQVRTATADAVLLDLQHSTSRNSKRPTSSSTNHDRKPSATIRTSASKNCTAS